MADATILGSFNNPHLRCAGSAADEAFTGILGAFALHVPTTLLTVGASGTDANDAALLDLTRVMIRNQPIATPVLEMAVRVATGFGEETSSPLAEARSLLTSIAGNRYRFRTATQGKLLRMKVTAIGGPDRLADALGTASSSPLLLRVIGPDLVELMPTTAQVLLEAGADPHLFQPIAYVDPQAGVDPLTVVGLRPMLNVEQRTRCNDRLRAIEGEFAQQLPRDLDLAEQALLFSCAVQELSVLDRFQLDDLGGGLDQMLAGMAEQAQSEQQRAGIAALRAAFIGQVSLRGLWEVGARPLVLNLDTASPERILTLCSLFLDPRFAIKGYRKVVAVDGAALARPGAVQLATIIARLGRKHDLTLLVEDAALIDEPGHQTLRQLLPGVATANSQDLSDLQITSEQQSVDLGSAIPAQARAVGEQLRRGFSLDPAAVRVDVTSRPLSVPE